MSNNQGQTLVEALLATAVAITVVVALVGVGINSMRVANYSKDQAEATKLAREQLELLRNYRDTHSWSTGSDSFSTKAGLCVASCCVSLSDHQTIIVNPGATDVTCFSNNMYTVRYSVASSGSNYIVTVTVTFTEGSLTRNVTLTETFTNWRGS